MNVFSELFRRSVRLAICIQKRKRKISVITSLKRLNIKLNLCIVFNLLLVLCCCFNHNEKTYQIVSFEDSSLNLWGHSILPTEFNFDGADQRNRWCIGDGIVFQVSILEIPENAVHEKWRIYLQEKFLMGKHNCKLISQKTFDIADKWKGEKMLMTDGQDSFSYWFLSNNNFCIFASLTVRYHENFSSINSQMDNFFIFLQLFRKDNSGNLGSCKTERQYQVINAGSKTSTYNL